MQPLQPLVATVQELDEVQEEGLRRVDEAVTAAVQAETRREWGILHAMRCSIASAVSGCHSSVHI